MEHLKKKKKLLNDKGLSLVELIIVIAIIAVMSGIAITTVTLINSAKAKEAGVTFNSEVTDTATKAKSQVCVVQGVQQPIYRYCLKLYQASNGKYFIQHGYYNPMGATEAEKYLFYNEDNTNSGKGTSMSSRVEIRYTNRAGDTVKVNNSGDSGTVDHVYIVFNTDGTMREGFGTFTFYKRNGNEVSNVVIRKNGSHYMD